MTAHQESFGDRFNRLATHLTEALGSVSALVLSVVVVIVWALTGPIFHFSDTWQLVINTATTVVTFWMVFVIQNSANRDAKAVQLKLDEIIRATQGARNSMITLETAPRAVVAEAAKELEAVAEGGGQQGSEQVAPAQAQAVFTRARRASGRPRGKGQRGTSSGA
jgi:low affinity Fe/Cu permease